MRSTEPPRSRMRALLEDERGGVHVEGAMVATFLAMMFAGFLWIRHVASTELLAVRTVGRELWAPALAGCTDGTPAPPRTWTADYRPVQEEVSPEAAARMREVTAADSATATSHTATRPDLLGGGSIAIDARAGTACNAAMPSTAIPIRARILEIFCERLPLPANWSAGCDPDASTIGP